MTATPPPEYAIKPSPFSRRAYHALNQLVTKAVFRADMQTFFQTHPAAPYAALRISWPGTVDPLESAWCLHRAALCALLEAGEVAPETPTHTRVAVPDFLVGSRNAEDGYYWTAVCVETPGATLFSTAWDATTDEETLRLSDEAGRALCTLASFLRAASGAQRRMNEVLEPTGHRIGGLAFARGLLLISSASEFSDPNRASLKGAFGKVLYDVSIRTHDAVLRAGSPPHQDRLN